MPLSRLLLVAITVVLFAGLAWWWQSGTAGVANNTAIAGTTLRSEQAPTTPPLRPSVVTAATKLGQGRRAVAGMPTVDDYSLPTLRDTAAGLALQIPNTPLPGTAAQQFTKPDKSKSGRGLWVRFDIYSWSEGVLVATASTPVELTPERNLLDVPDALEALRSEFATNARLMLVLPAGSPDLPDGLNPNDAYVLIAEREA